MTISAFNPESLESNSPATVAGDYSAVFPLLVVAVFVSLMASRDTVVYIKQRSRGDITAVPEVLCRPGMEGAPYVVDYDGEQCDDNAEYSDIEYALASGDNTKTILQKDSSAQVSSYLYIPTASTSFDNDAGLSSSRLDELLGLSVHDENKPGLDSNDPWRAQISSEIIKGRSKQGRPGSNDTPTGSGSNRERSNSAGSQQGLVRVNSFGEVSDHQPSLMDQARLRSASSASETKHRRVPSLPTALPGLPKHQHFRASSLTTPRNT